VFENKDVLEMDDTPTGAMRKLLGSSSRPHHLIKTDRAVSATRTSTLHAQTSSPSKSAATHPVNPVDQPHHVQPSVTLPQLDAKQVKALLQMLAVTSDVNDKAKAPDDRVLLQTLERIEKAEKAAEAREERLRMMLEEVSHGMIPADDQARANCSWCRRYWVDLVRLRRHIWCNTSDDLYMDEFMYMIQCGIIQLSDLSIDIQKDWTADLVDLWDDALGVSTGILERACHSLLARKPWPRRF
jgi:hypothetical protein